MSNAGNENSLQEWNKLYVAADKFFQLAPWNWMADNDLFALVDPRIPETLFGCVMGQQGEHYALAGYVGEMGMQGYFQIATGNHDESMGDILGIQYCLMASFENRDALEANDRNIITLLNRRYRGKQVWPLFREYKPGFFPWFLTPTQITWLTTLLEQSLLVAEYAREHKDGLSRACRTEGKILARVLRNPNDETSWETIWLPFDPETYLRMNAVPLWQATKTDLSSLTQTINQTESLMGTWEVEVFYGSMYVKERDDVRPYFPPMTLIVDHDSGFVLGTALTQQTQEMPQAIVEELEKIVSTHHTRPKRLLVKQQELFELFAPLKKQSVINCEMVEQLPGCREAKDSLNASSYH